MISTQDVSVPWWEKLLGALTLGIMDVVIQAISIGIENAAGAVTNSKTAQALGGVAPGLVLWAGQTSINMIGGGLEDNVFMRGTLS
jgi:hypothetical protein